MVLQSACSLEMTRSDRSGIPELLIIAGSAQPSRRDVSGFIVTFALTSGFFAADMALFQPR